MSVRYPRWYLRTRTQLLLQCATLALILLPPLIWRLSLERAPVSLSLGGMALAALSLAYQGLRFLRREEARHAEPTPQMTFVFSLVAVYPLALAVFLLILLTER